MAKVELKQPVVDEIKGVLEGAAGAVIVDYRGLTVEQDTQLRKKLREAGVTYKVYKNTLIKRAAEGTAGRTDRISSIQGRCDRSCKDFSRIC